MCASISFMTLLTATLFQGLVNGQLLGAINHIGDELGGMVLVTLENNSTGNYSMEAINNLFDDANPYQPLNVNNLAGEAINLLGNLASYGPLSDTDFISMPPGAFWQREFNMTEYLPPDSTIAKPTSECYVVSISSGMWAINTTSFTANEDLATGFFNKKDPALTYVQVVSTPLHVNITSLPETDYTAAALASVTAEPAPTQVAATLIIPSETAGPGGSAPAYGSSINSYLSSDDALS
ncbi:hypothetical protein P7C71_g2945, partial [Lecanoromycetidae sp. Uapishka_2]